MPVIKFMPQSSCEVYNEKSKQQNSLTYTYESTVTRGEIRFFSRKN